jgi:c-di-GMP-binding flagellar brake protein YcgR
VEEKIERREYFRVKDVLQLTIKKLPPFSVMPSARFVGYTTAFSTDVNVPSDDVDPFIVRQFQAIHQKLDMLLEYLSLDKLGFNEVEYHEVDISAGGIRIITPERFEEGDNVEIRIVFPTAPPLYLICYGKVIRCTSCNLRSEVAVEFVNMSEDVRSLIMKYVMQKQRQEIRR